MIRVIQWATGSMGRTGLRRIIDATDLTLAGAYVYGSKKVGTDAGALAKREDTGVLATNDRAEILSIDADAVLHCPRITQPYDALVDDVVALLESGKNVISIAGFHWPAAHGADYARRLEDAAKKGGATLAGVGVNPGMIVERLALTASAMSHELDRISVFETVDASAMASPEFVFGLMGLDSNPAERDIREGRPVRNPVFRSSSFLRRRTGRQCVRDRARSPVDAGRETDRDGCGPHPAGARGGDRMALDRPDRCGPGTAAVDPLDRRSFTAW